ncbi:hypothetical protein QZH41_002088 [Actinostola sp. cb2023]|nr:hypothetical protein QZH41_002088 [Actinostola sp. cb2023]
MATNASNMTNIPANFRCFRPEYSISFQYNYFKTSYSILAPLNILCVLLSTIANCLILITVYRKKCLRTPSMLLLCSLNLKDLCFVGVTQTIELSQSLVYLANDNFCTKSQFIVRNVSIFTLFCGRTIGLISVILISLDRWVAIHKPFLYRKWGLKSRRVFASVSVVWVIGIALGGLAPFLKIQDLSKLMVMLFGSTAIIVTLLQLGVYIGVRRQRKRTADLNASQLRQMALERTVATGVLYIILALAVCYIPFLTSVAILFLGGRNYVFFGRIWFQFALYLNAFINPLVMLKTNKILKIAVLERVISSYSCGQHRVLAESLASTSGSKTTEDDIQPKRKQKTQETDMKVEGHQEENSDEKVGEGVGRKEEEERAK